jgi:flagellar hook protein FlgE
MGLISSIYAAVSGLQLNSQELSVVGDNIANVNTIGFKRGRAVFEDSLAQWVVGPGSGQIGNGARAQTVQKMMGQGALLQTGVGTDLAIQGSGFFIAQGEVNGSMVNYFTRAGQFTIDEEGFLSTLNGMRIQGYEADAVGNIMYNQTNLPLGDTSFPPLASQEVTLKANLDAQAEVLPPVDLGDLGGTTNFSTTTTIYDSLGTPHQVDIYFHNDGAGQWSWVGLTDGGGLDGGVPGEATQIASGTMTFDQEGKMATHTQASSFAPADALPQDLNFNLGDPTATNGTGLGGITQFSAPSAASFINQDGYPPGELAGIQINETGQVLGTFTNGQSRTLAQLAWLISLPQINSCVWAAICTLKLLKRVRPILVPR